MSNSRFMVVVLIGVGLVGLGLSAFTVNERELAIKLQVGQVVRSGYEPGIHFKIPVYQTVRKFPSRILK
ncbi:MAG: protease modulator HflC, partial [Gammaproteobacteria bacterium]|nr:protease modulator HflC [Gammaproteobacteria bacterium]